MNTFVVANPNKCIGCRSCEIACAVAHLGTSVATAGAVSAPFQPRLALVKTPMVTMPIQCRQCEDAPCANVCPVKAISHQGDRIIVDTEICIGCKTCMLACPLGAMDMVEEYTDGEKVYQDGLKVSLGEEGTEKEKVVAHKCDLCKDRPGGPACLEVCVAKAFVLVQPQSMDTSIKQRRAASVLEIARSR